MLDQKSDIRGSGEVIAAAKVFRDERAAPSASKKANVPEVLAGLDATRISPDQVPRFV